MAHSTTGLRSLPFLLIAGSWLACHDNQTLDADAFQQMDQGAADIVVDAQPADTTPPDTGPPPPCSEQIVGKACTATGGECGPDHTCLRVTAAAGFCTCACIPEDLATPAKEDSCPGSELVCARYAPQSGAAQSYCFQYIGNVQPGCINKLTHNWDTPFSFPYANMELTRLTPSTAFAVLGVRYILGGEGAGGSIPCDSTVPHRVDVWIDTNSTPAPTPAVATTVTVTPATQGKYVATAVTLDKLLPVGAGEHLFVAVEMSNKVSDKAMCIVNCGVGTTGDNSYTSWTNAPVNNSPPYTWSSYKTMGSSQELSTLALGFAGAP